MAHDQYLQFIAWFAAFVYLIPWIMNYKSRFWQARLDPNADEKDCTLYKSRTVTVMLQKFAETLPRCLYKRVERGGRLDTWRLNFSYDSV